MSNQKRKNELQPTQNRRTFIILWVISTFFAQGIFNTITSHIDAWLYLVLPQILLARSLILFMLLPFVQVILVERFLKRSMKGWMAYTLIGVGVAWLVYLVIQLPFYLGWIYVGSYSDGGSLIGTLLFAIPTALFQFLWLRRHVRSAWLWPLVVLTMSLATQGLRFYALQNEIRSQGTMDLRPYLLSLGMTLLYGLVTGVTLRSLFSASLDLVKDKRDQAQVTSHPVDHSLRLQEIEHSQVINTGNAEQTASTSR